MPEIVKQAGKLRPTHAPADNQALRRLDNTGYTENDELLHQSIAYYLTLP